MRDIEQTTTESIVLHPGDIIQSRYQILNQLGSGGFPQGYRSAYSRTYLAEDLNRFNERCVLQEFAPQLKETSALAKAQKLFEREVGVLYRLKHPQIPQFRQLFSYKYEDRGCLFLVQDYVEGATYHDLLNQRLAVGKQFSEAEVKQLLTQVLPILEYIHSMGVIHRDISPDNLIWRQRDQFPVLINFGCIKEVEIKTQSELTEVTSNQGLPLRATVLGKAGYAAPEQAEQGIVYAHSDLYALAATAVVLLTGKEPQELIDLKDNRWYWRSHINLSSKLEWILSTMLSPHSSDRFGSAAEVSKTLQDISTITTVQFQKTNDSNYSRLQAIKPKIALTGNLLAKSLFIIPFSAVLIFAGYLCLKVANLKAVNSISSSDNVTIEERLEDRFSQGEKVLISQTTTPEKELAMAAFARENYYHAASLLTVSLQTKANDPESLIYLHNARIGAAKAYSIAVSIPIGSDVNVAQEILRGVAQAQDRINQSGGINELPLKVQIINDDNDPEIAMQIASNLGQNKEILGVVGHYASDVTLSTAPIYEAEKLVAISPISTSVKLSNLSPYIFRTVPSDHLAARGLTEYMLENLQQTKVAVFYNSKSNYSDSLQSEFSTAVALAGGEVVDIFDLADANFNAGDSLAQAIANDAETIMLAADTGTLDKALQVVQVNNKRLNLLGGDDVYTPKTLQIAGEQGENMVLAIPWHIRNNADDEFAQTAKQLWGGEVSWRSAMAYDASQALITAIEGNPNPTRISIQKNLSENVFLATGASNRVKFLPSGDRSAGIQLVKMQPSENKFGYEFVPIEGE